MLFNKQAERILDLAVDCPVNEAGGYGHDGEVLYQAYPSGCPSVLADSGEGGKAVFVSNGSLEFLVDGEDGVQIPVLESSFDNVEKRETGVPSHNAWIRLGGQNPVYCSLVNSRAAAGISPVSIRVVKIGDPFRQMWYCSRFSYHGKLFETAVKLALVSTKSGPALFRGFYLRNTGKRSVDCSLWTYFNMHGTQQYVYNKQIWYDSGMPLNNREQVICARVPYTDNLQIKRVASFTQNARPVESTCDYSSFIGDSSHYSILPAAVAAGKLCKRKEKKLNRFATASVAASNFSMSIPPGGNAVIGQSLLYVADCEVVKQFALDSMSETPSYRTISTAFSKAARALVKSTPGAREVSRMAGFKQGERSVTFEFSSSRSRIISEYAGSLWTGVEELYENCRAHGARLAEGIELGTRDRGQDMWPKMKADPGRVRADLAHAFSFMYVTVDKPLSRGRRLSLREKLHGMFPRQYPSRWKDRGIEVANDNRPYADSPLWLINSLYWYLRETGDLSILNEKVMTVSLTDPDNPVDSTMIGCRRRLKVIEVVLEILRCFARHVEDSPYGLAQVMYGDWCDPIDMFGTLVVGDVSTRGQGRGVNLRLSGHLFECLVQVLDLLHSKDVKKALKGVPVRKTVEELASLASKVRQNAIRWGWEDVGPGKSGFVGVIHEFKADGSIPDYSSGETGYTLGSMSGTDFDGAPRRELVSQAYGLMMLATIRDYLQPVSGGELKIKSLLECVDKMFYDSKLGLKLFTTPVANNAEVVRLVGRMGVLPSGTAENGEYHHGQLMMHVFRMMIDGEENKVWSQFKPVVSAFRGVDLCGPFEMPCTSYVSDPDDPHYGKGMYFGLSGSTDWIIRLFEQIAGIELNLHDSALPDVVIRPRVPRQLGEVFLKRMVHVGKSSRGYRKVPLNVKSVSGAGISCLSLDESH